MKRTQFIQHVTENGCIIKREGSKHSICMNIKTGKRTSIPRHSELKDTFCNEICKQLGIPKVK